MIQFIVYEVAVTQNIQASKGIDIKIVIFKDTACKHLVHSIMQLFLYFAVLSSEPEPDLHKQMTPPKFVKPLASVDVAEGTPATLEAITEGNPAPQVTWYREGHQIMPSNDFQVIVHVINKKNFV